jgi:hypothetical protein
MSVTFNGPSYSRGKNQVAGFRTGYLSTWDEELSEILTQVTISENVDAIIRGFWMIEEYQLSWDPGDFPSKRFTNITPISLLKLKHIQSKLHKATGHATLFLHGTSPHSNAVYISSSIRIKFASFYNQAFWSESRDWMIGRLATYVYGPEVNIFRALTAALLRVTPHNYQFVTH